jgi:hypothetical protein
MAKGRDHQAVRPVLPAMRVLLVAFSALTLLAVVSLFIGSELTGTYFAWTIEPPLTAAYLGAGYAAGSVLVLLSLRTRAWADARVPVVTILVFTILTLIATLLHLDRFHFGATGIARLAAWLWMAVYVLVPPAIVALLVAQERVPGGAPPRRLPLPRWLVTLLAVQGAVLLAIGVALFLAPGVSALVWPWPLSPLTSRAVGAWQVAFGVAAVLAIRSGDLARLRTAAVASTAFAVLELVAVARYAEVVAWGAPALGVWVAVAAAFLVSGVYAWRASGWASSGSSASTWSPTSTTSPPAGET